MKRFVTPISAVIIGLAVGAGVIYVMGLDPAEAYRSLLKGALGSKNGLAETVVKATPLIFTGLSFAVARMAGLLNIGAEGQLYVGGLTGIAVGIYLQGLPLAVHLPLALLAGFVGGGLWGLIAGALKVRFGASEIITTVMLNYVAIYLVSLMVTGPMIEPPGNFPQSPPVLDSARLPVVVSGTRLHLGFVVALLMVVFYYVFLWHTTVGYEARVSGHNPRAAGYAGMNAVRNTLFVMFLAGGMGGLAGASELLGVQHRLFQNFSPGYGFDGIAVALLGYNSPIGIILASLLFGGLRSGGNMMQMTAGVPVAIVYVIQAVVIIFVACEELFRRWQKNKVGPKFNLRSLLSAQPREVKKSHD
ncbi:MAG TPA: ABC transporter permease [Peptococcaceae bacterium]|nr:ABC transporter permease [Peptococcaceae bacterium]